MWSKVKFYATGPLKGVLDTVANIAIVVVACVVLYNMWSGYHQQAVEAAKYLKVGDTSPIIFAGSKPTLAVVMSPDCHFCRESAPFYRSLTSNKVRIVALMPDKQKGEEYLRSEKLDFPVIVADSQTMRVHGTPTMMLVSPNGKVTRVWPGKLVPAVEQAVLAELKGIK